MTDVDLEPMSTEAHDREYATGMVNCLDELVNEMLEAANRLARARDELFKKRAEIEAQRAYRDNDGRVCPPPVAEYLERSINWRLDQTMQVLRACPEWLLELIPQINTMRFM